MVNKPVYIFIRTGERKEISTYIRNVSITANLDDVSDVGVEQSGINSEDVVVVDESFIDDVVNKAVVSLWVKVCN